jgi:hypothetical protein
VNGSIASASPVPRNMTHRVAVGAPARTSHSSRHRVPLNSRRDTFIRAAEGIGVHTCHTLMLLWLSVALRCGLRAV